jgi:hypothetical protein
MIPFVRSKKSNQIDLVEQIKEMSHEAAHENAKTLDNSS